MARDRDDGDYDSGRRRARPRKKSNTTAILLAVGGVVGLLALACGGVAVVALLPAFRATREQATTRLDAQDNLAKMALGAHRQAKEPATGGLVGPYAVDGQGTVRPGLSFRVGLLPYLGEGALHGRLDLTQPWDAPRNAAATATPVAALMDPAAARSGRPDSPYRAFYGGGALFEADGKPVPFNKVTDGLSTTILFVHAAEAVPWAKPAEFAYSEATPLPRLGSPATPGGFTAAMGDGSVRFIRDTISEWHLRGLIGKADGRVVVIE